MEPPLLPHTYPRRILLVVIGLTPQITTEVLYKLAVDCDPAFVPTEVHIVTTEAGARSASVALLGLPGSVGWFHRFCDDFGFQNIQFNKSLIHVIEDTENQFLNDAESTQHNQAAADFITRLIQDMTVDSGSSLHVSLAGGRKTMSFYAGYALSLYGRTQDRLSHVMINAPFMNHPGFFYPRPNAERLEINNQYFSTDDAKIVLADIPYVRMRGYVPSQLLNGEAGFQETVEKLQRFATMETLEVHVKEREIVINNICIPLPASDMAFYSWMVHRASKNEIWLNLDEDTFIDDYLEIYTWFVSRNSGRFEQAKNVAQNGDMQQQKNWFYQRKSKVNRKLNQALEKRLASTFLIQADDTHGYTRYGIAIDTCNIKIIN